MFLRHVIVFSFIALLAGCAGFGARESVEGQGNPAQWKQHKDQLSSIDGWQIDGKVGVRAPKDSGSGTLFWLQRQDYYDIRLSGPLGRGDLAARAARPLSDAILFSTFPEVGTAEEGAAFARLSREVKLTRYGTDCYAYALIAAGQIDLVVEAGLQPYDVGAPIAVIEAAGGVVTDWQGGPAWRGGRVLAAANAEIHAAAMAVLNA